MVAGGGGRGRGGEGRGGWVGCGPRALPTSAPEAGLPSRQVETISHLAPGTRPHTLLLLSLESLSPCRSGAAFPGGKGRVGVSSCSGALTQHPS